MKRKIAGGSQLLGAAVLGLKLSTFPALACLSGSEW
jgi:hypothetical protein